MKICCMAALVLSLAIPARAQEQTTDPPGRKLIISERAIAAALAEHPPAPPARQRDSVGNGALIGGFLVGIGLAATGGWVCHALKEPGDPSCWPGILRIGAIGFGAGALAGAGIDALFDVGGPAPRRRVRESRR